MTIWGEQKKDGSNPPRFWINGKRGRRQCCCDDIPQCLEGMEAFDLITLDISMPDLSGSDALKMIRVLERKKAWSLRSR